MIFSLRVSSSSSTCDFLLFQTFSFVFIFLVSGMWENIWSERGTLSVYKGEFECNMNLWAIKLDYLSQYLIFEERMNTCVENLRASSMTSWILRFCKVCFCGWKTRFFKHVQKMPKRSFPSDSEVFSRNWHNTRVTPITIRHPATHLRAENRKTGL